MRFIFSNLTAWYKASCQLLYQLTQVRQAPNGFFLCSLSPIILPTMLLSLFIYDALSHSLMKPLFIFKGSLFSLRPTVLFLIDHTVPFHNALLTQGLTLVWTLPPVKATSRMIIMCRLLSEPTTTPLSTTIHVRHHNLLGSFPNLKSLPLCLLGFCLALVPAIPLSGKGDVHLVPLYVGSM